MKWDTFHRMRATDCSADFAAYRPPHLSIAPLPKNEMDPNNFKPVDKNPGKLVAPRVTTPVNEADIPDEVDFLIVGSGAGGVHNSIPPRLRR